MTTWRRSSPSPPSRHGRRCADAARVLGKPYSVGDRISKAMPPLIMGRDTPLGACLERDDKHADGYAAAAELRTMYTHDDEVREVVDVARGLEGLIRQDSVHAAAVVISPEPLTTYLPIQRKPEAGTDPDEAPIVTQFDMGGVEDLGLLKMDFLGLRTLSIIDETVRLVERTAGERLDIDSVPLDDPAAFELLRAGDTMGVFQLESTPVRSLLRSDAAHPIRGHLRTGGAVPARSHGSRHAQRLRPPQERPPARRAAAS